MTEAEKLLQLMGLDYGQARGTGALGNPFIPTPGASSWQQPQDPGSRQPTGPMAEPTVQTPDVSQQPQQPYQPPDVQGQPSFVDQLSRIVTSPLFAGGLGALSGLLMTPKWAGPGYRIGASLMGGGQAMGAASEARAKEQERQLAAMQAQQRIGLEQRRTDIEAQAQKTREQAAGIMTPEQREVFKQRIPQDDPIAKRAAALVDPESPTFGKDYRDTYAFISAQEEKKREFDIASDYKERLMEQKAELEAMRRELQSQRQDATTQIALQKLQLEQERLNNTLQRTQNDLDTKQRQIDNNAHVHLSTLIGQFISMNPEATNEQIGVYVERVGPGLGLQVNPYTGQPFGQAAPKGRPPLSDPLSGLGGSPRG